MGVLGESTDRFVHTVLLSELIHDGACECVVADVGAKLLQVAYRGTDRGDTFRDHCVLFQMKNIRPFCTIAFSEKT